MCALRIKTTRLQSNLSLQYKVCAECKQIELAPATLYSSCWFEATRLFESTKKSRATKLVLPTVRRLNHLCECKHTKESIRQQHLARNA